MIAEMAVIAIDNTDDNMFKTVLPMLLLVVVQVTLAMISLKSKKFRDFVEGKPTILINRGKIDENEMKKQRYNFDDLLLQLRENNIRNIADVEFAILEPSGKLSVFAKQNDQKGDLMIPLIVDGAIQDENLERIQRDNHWLTQELRKKGYKDLNNISFCSYQNGDFYIDVKDEK